MTTADRLRHEIDQGRTGDKVRVQDPAAAPLGTDDEAGGAPPTRAQVDMAMRHEVGSHPHSAPATQDNHAVGTSDRGGRLMFWGLLIGAAALSAIFIAVM
jgi:hypothetical protein